MGQGKWKSLKYFKENDVIYWYDEESTFDFQLKIKQIYKKDNNLCATLERSTVIYKEIDFWDSIEIKILIDHSTGSEYFEMPSTISETYYIVDSIYAPERRPYYYEEFEEEDI